MINENILFQHVLETRMVCKEHGVNSFSTEHYIVYLKDVPLAGETINISRAIHRWINLEKAKQCKMADCNQTCDVIREFKTLPKVLVIETMANIRG